MSDPFIVMSAVAQGLNLVDKFTDLTRKIFGAEHRPFSVQAKQEGDAIEIQHDGVVAERISTTEMNMPAWDEQRYETLKEKIDAHWEIFNDIDKELPTASIDEKARLKRKLKTIRDDLCEDFREFVELAEKILGKPLGDHYSLYEVCSMEMPSDA